MQDQREVFFGVSQEEICAWCNVNRTTAMRWKKGRSRAPGAALALVRLRVYGEAEALLGAAWRGWRFGRDGLLYAPGWRRGFAPGEILALPYLHGQLAAIRSHRAARALAPAAAPARSAGCA